MKLFNILISIALVLGLYFYLSLHSPETSDQTTQELKIKPIGQNADLSNENSEGNTQKNSSELPSDIKDAMTKPESHSPEDLPEDLKAQLNAPPPELPEDLKRQLNLPPQELPEDLKAQLNSPPPELPEDMKKALSMPPRVVTIDEVNTPPDLNSGPEIENETNR